ncbi:MAG: helix-turn-helix domain-containing protein [Algicola sp.]|nr:helix-turn-helix domain-containing protein [Algicola sp.]
MNSFDNEIQLPTVKAIKNLLNPIYERLNQISSQLSSQKEHKTSPKFYRNNDLKEIFNISNNTIIKYRETGILPYTKMGDIYLYEVKEIDKILKQNYIKINL